MLNQKVNRSPMLIKSEEYDDGSFKIIIYDDQTRVVINKIDFYDIPKFGVTLDYSIELRDPKVTNIKLKKKIAKALRVFLTDVVNRAIMLP